jgi:gamma-glutamyltranspeptidase/glutathione hydrolase
VLVEPATGINLHNRGMGFSLEEGHPAEYGPGRRPPHTLSPLVVTDPDGRFVAVLGTQGGDGQPQILLQLLDRLLRHQQRPAEALAEPRWVLTGTGRGFDTWTAPDGPAVSVERRAAPAWHDGLAARGHRVVVAGDWDHEFGHAQVICNAGDGFLAGAADPRARIGAAAGR